jgi:plasmid maintenance system killer protein
MVSTEAPKDYSSMNGTRFKWKDGDAFEVEIVDYH